MKVQNMVNSKGNRVKNQFIIIDDMGNQTFQSYETTIAKISHRGNVVLDAKNWNCSVTTGKYRNIFLGESKKETESKIESGIYQLSDLNK